MQLLSWAPEHSAALREFVERGMSYADAADAVNARFGTAYSRSAAIGRAKRMGLVVGGRAEGPWTWGPGRRRDPMGEGTGQESEPISAVASPDRRLPLLTGSSP